MVTVKVNFFSFNTQQILCPPFQFCMLTALSSLGLGATRIAPPRRYPSPCDDRLRQRTSTDDPSQDIHLLRGLRIYASPGPEDGGRVYGGSGGDSGTVLSVQNVDVVQIHISKIYFMISNKRANIFPRSLAHGLAAKNCGKMRWIHTKTMKF